MASSRRKSERLRVGDLGHRALLLDPVLFPQEACADGACVVALSYAPWPSAALPSWQQSKSLLDWLRSL